MNVTGGYTPPTRFEVSTKNSPPETGSCSVTTALTKPSFDASKQDTESLGNKLLPLVREIMKSLSKQSAALPKNSQFRVSDNDKKIAGTISFILDQANKQGDQRLYEISNRIQLIIQGYSMNPSQCRYQLSEITHEMFVEHLPETKHVNNKNFMNQWEQLLDTRLKCFKKIADKELACPIGSFGEEPPKWFARYKPPKLSPVDYFLNKTCRSKSKEIEPTSFNKERVR